MVSKGCKGTTVRCFLRLMTDTIPMEAAEEFWALSNRVADTLQQAPIYIFDQR